MPPSAPTSPTPPPSLPRRYLLLALLLILSLASLILAWAYIPNYGPGVDEASYLLAAKGLATHLDPAYLSPDPTALVPENMIEARPGIFYPKYPIGYPLLCSVAYRAALLLGTPPGDAPFLVNPLLMLIALLGAFFLARQFLDDLFALAAMLFLAAHPVTLYYGVTALSHASDLACSTWCLYFAYSWYRRPHPLKAALAGLLFGYAISIRYTEALLALPLLYLALLRLLDTRRTPPATTPPLPLRTASLHLTFALLASLLGILPLLLYHYHAFGSPFTTGYSLTGESAAFSLSFFKDHALVVLQTLTSFSAGLSLLFPLAFLGLIYLFKKQLRTALFLALWSLPTLLLYTAYYWSNAATPLLYTRFFLSLFPAFLISAFLPLDLLTRPFLPLRYSAITLLVILASFTLSTAPYLSTIQGTAVSDRAATLLVQHSLPPDSVILAHTYSAYSLVYFTDMTVFYPPYFSPNWVHDRLLTPTEKHGTPADFNPLRAQRFEAALGHRSQEQLIPLLEERLLSYSRQGRTLALLISTEVPPWYDFLAQSFTLTPLAQDPDQHLLLLRLDPRPAK